MTESRGSAGAAGSAEVEGSTASEKNVEMERNTASEKNAEAERNTASGKNVEAERNTASEKNAEAENIARSVLTLARNALVVNFRFLDRAVSGLDFISNENVSLTTDGVHIYFGPWYILHCYKKEQNVLSRDLFHLILHCVFRHNFIGPAVDQVRWDLACDIAVENALTEFDRSVLHVRREAGQQAMIALLKADLPALTAERIYKWLNDHDFSDEELSAEREKFLADAHGPWYNASDPDTDVQQNIDLKKLWEDISKRMQTELETMQNDKNSALVQNLRSLNRAKYSYTDFLRRFGVHGEVMRLSDEEFDHNYYTYGMELYGNIPLVEPLEYTEQRRIREFVIAVDTSGSVRGDVVQAFIQHTYTILSQRETFFTKVNIHILQCDDQIRDDARITCGEDLEQYIRTLEIRGLEKTDFRPVFKYVDELIRTRELTRLQGLLYFTDGDGIFPVKKPDYETAFILSSSEFGAPDLPPWAMHIDLSEEELLDKRLSSC